MKNNYSKSLYVNSFTRSNFFLLILIQFSGLTFAQPPEARAVDSLIQVSDTIADLQKRMENYHRIASFNLNYNAAIAYDYSVRTRNLSLELKNREYELLALKNLASYYMRSGNHDSSLIINGEAKRVAEELGDFAMQAHLLRDLGRVYYLQGKYPESLAASFEAAGIFEDLEDISGLATTYNSIGNIYMSQKNHLKAIEYMSLSLENCRKLNDQTGMVMVMGGLASNFAQSDNPAKAVEYYSQAIALAREIDFKMGLALNLNNLALFYMDKNDFEKALENLSESYVTYKAINVRDGMALSMGNMGVAYYRSFKLHNRRDTLLGVIRGSKEALIRNAIEKLTGSVEIYQQIGQKDALVYFANELSEAHASVGNYQQALHFYRLRTAISDSLNTIQSKERIEQLTTEREVELKNKQIELDRLAVQKKRNERVYFIIGLGFLSLAIVLIARNYSNQKKANLQLKRFNLQIAQTNQLLEQKNMALTAAMNELKMTQSQLIESEKQKEKALIRERISQDIHDDISAGLTKISWLAEMLKVKTYQGDDTKEVAIVDKILNFSRDSVSRLGEIIWSTNPDKDNLESLLAYIRRYVSGYLEDTPVNYLVNFPDEIPSKPVNPELRRNLFLAFKEALHNAIKYSKAENIEVSFQTDWNGYSLIIADNGIGIEEDVVHGGGFGFNNMRKRMEAIGGNFAIESSSKKGVRVILEGNLYS